MQQINFTELNELAKTLVACKSITPNQDGCIDFIQTYLKDIGFHITRIDRGNTSNLVATYGNSAPIFAFAGHVDVVPTGDLLRWDNDPFTLTHRDGYLYGRGIADMKGAIAAFLIATKKYITNIKLTNGTLALLITSDEEGVAVDGTPVIVEYLQKNNIIIDYCILGEPTSFEKIGDVVKVGRRGSLTGTIQVEGKQGHIAYPELCINPIHEFAPALLELATTTWDNGNKFFPASSFQFANINSGLGVNNVIPNILMASFNFRYNTEHSAESLKIAVEYILDRHNIKYTIDWQNSAKPFMTKSGLLIKTIIDSVEEHQNFKPQLKTDGGTSDGRFLITVCNEIVEFGLTNKSIHQINECIKDTELVDLSNNYFKIISKIFNEKN